MDLNSFNSIQVDAVREIVNIGSGNAATAMSELVGSVVNMDVPKAELVSIYEVSSHYGSPDEYAYGILIRTEGDMCCNLVFLLEEKGAMVLTDILLNQRFPNLDEAMREEMADSALAEVGNIILGAFLRALSSMTGWFLPMSVPALAHDMLGSLLDIIVASFGVMGDTALLVQTALTVENQKQPISGTVVMIPDPGAMEHLLERLGVL